MQKISAIKLLKKAIILIIPIYLLWFSYIEFMPDYYNKATNTRWNFINKSLEKKYLIPKSDIIFLGESRVNAGIDFTKITNSYSFASGGASPTEMYYILKKYSENYQCPKTVYLSISPRFLSETFAFYPYAVRNNLFSYSDFKEITSILQKNDTTIGTYPFLKFFLYKLNYLEYYQSDVAYNNVFGGYSKNKILIKRMIKHKGGRPHPGLKKNSSELNYETKYKHFVPSKLLNHYFNNIFKFCKEKNIQLNFFFMPMNESSYKELNPDFILEYKNYIHKFKEKYPAFSISDSIYSYPNNLFGDESHLNYKGKKVFTKNFIEKYHLK